MDKIAEKKEAILKTTLQLVNKQGFHGTPMSQVAKEAGVAAGTIYHYFESKDQLICEVFSFIMNGVTETVRQHDRDDLPFKERFFKLWQSLFGYYTSNPSVLVFFEQFINSPYSATLIGNEKYDKVRNMMVCFMNKGLEAGLLKPMRAEVLGTLVLSNVISMSKIKSRGTLNVSDDELTQVVQVLWDGLKLK